MYVGRLVMRNIHKFHSPIPASIYLKRNVLPSSSTIYLSINQHTSIAHMYQHRRLINTPTHKKPDPFHRVYRRAQTPRETNRWMEKVILALMLGICLFPLGFMYNYFDGTVPITNRKRFLIIPFWLDNLVGTYTLAALGIGQNEEEDTENNTETQQESSDNPYDINTRQNKGDIMSSNDKRVAHIEGIFDTIITKNYLKKCDSEKEKEYVRLTPKMLKRFHEFEWKINIVDKLSVVNAMCVPGGKMIIYTGILKEVVSNDNECAAIIAHEIGHALCRHGIEQMQWRLFFIACIYVAFNLVGIDLSWMVDKMLTFGVNLLLQLPMSRRAELEADEVAIYLMENSGYDIDALVSVMDKLGKVQDRIGHMPEIISTHPLTENRIQILKEKIDKAKKKKVRKL